MPEQEVMGAAELEQALREQASLEQMMLKRIRGACLPEPVEQLRPFSHRKFRFDFAWPEFKLLLEVQGSFGGQHGQGCHRSITGFKRDCDKFSLAAAEGWAVLMVERNMIRSGKAVAYLERALKNRGYDVGKKKQDLPGQTFLCDPAPAKTDPALTTLTPQQYKLHRAMWDNRDRGSTVPELERRLGWSSKKVRTVLRQLWIGRVVTSDPEERRNRARVYRVTGFVAR